MLAPVSESGQKQPYAGIDAIWFNADTAVWPSSHHRLVRCVYRLDINEYRGQQSLQLMIQFLEPLGDREPLAN